MGGGIHNGGHMSSTNLSGILSRLYETTPALQPDTRKTFGGGAPSSWAGQARTNLPSLQPDAKKTINTGALTSGGEKPLTNSSPLQPLYTVGQKYGTSNAPVLDWATFQKYLTPALYNDGTFDPEARAAWTQQLGLDLGGKPSLSIAGLSASQFAKPVDWSDVGSGWERAEAQQQALADAYQSPEWHAAVDKAMQDPNTVYNVGGDWINADGTTTGGRTRSVTQYKLENEQLVPIDTNNFKQSSGWKDFSEALPYFAAALAPAAAAYLGGTTAVGAAGTAAETAGSSQIFNPALIDSALGTTGYGASSAGLGGLEAAGAGALGTLGDTGIPAFEQLPGYGNEIASLADASGASPFTGYEDALSGMDLAADAGTGANSVEAAGSVFPGLDPYDAKFWRPVGEGIGNLGNMTGNYGVLPSGVLSDSGGLSNWLDKGGNWLGNLASGDKTALNQARMGLGAVGLIGQLLQGNKPRNQLTPDQLQAAVKGPYDKWTGGNQAAFDKFAGTDLSKFQFTPPRLAHGGPAPHDAHCRCTMCSGGAVSSYARGSLVRGPGGGQDDQVHAMLSPGEYIMDADTVSALGDGDNATGADKLDQMRENLRAHKRSAPPSKIPPRAHAPEHYLHKKGR